MRGKANKNWPIQWIWTVGIIVSFGLSNHAIANNPVESIQSYLYDRGLVQHNRSWISVENAALLCQQDEMRLHMELHRVENQLLNFSFASPISSRMGFGLAWYSRTLNNVIVSKEATLNQTWKDQYFIVNLGLNQRINWGQQLEIMNSQRVAYPLHVGAHKPRTSQVISVVYRLGFYHQLMRRLYVGLVSAPLVQFSYHVYPQGGHDPEMKIEWLRELETNLLIPQIAVSWQWTDRLQSVISNRSRNGEFNWQISHRYSQPSFSFYVSSEYDEKEDELNVSGGLSTHIKGMDLIAAYSFSDESIRLGVGFSPEQRRQLIDVQGMAVRQKYIYPYHQLNPRREILSEFTVQNQIQQVVKLTVNLRGEHLPSVILHYELNPLEIKQIQIPIPEPLYEMTAGHYVYHVSCTAFQRGRQTIEEQFGFTICDSHNWSGLSDDLVYFVKPLQSNVLALGRQLSMLDVPNDASLQMSIVKRIYEYINETIHYIPDPKGVLEIGDQIQYPEETLACKSGDCEDLSILMISLLKSVGIDAAFAEYVKPDSKQGHVFILIDSGLSTENAVSQSKNLQRYILRYDNSGRPRLYIPLELTESQLSFDESWAFSNEMYHQLAIEQGGLVEGWFHIIDVP